MIKNNIVQFKNYKLNENTLIPLGYPIGVSFSDTQEKSILNGTTICTVDYSSYILWEFLANMAETEQSTCEFYKELVNQNVASNPDFKEVLNNLLENNLVIKVDLNSMVSGENEVKKAALDKAKHIVPFRQGRGMGRLETTDGNEYFKIITNGVHTTIPYGYFVVWTLADGRRTLDEITRTIVDNCEDIGYIDMLSFVIISSIKLHQLNCAYLMNIKS